MLIWITTKLKYFIGNTKEEEDLSPNETNIQDEIIEHQELLGKLNSLRLGENRK